VQLHFSGVVGPVMIVLLQISGWVYGVPMQEFWKSLNIREDMDYGQEFGVLFSRFTVYCAIKNLKLTATEGVHEWNPKFSHKIFIYDVCTC